MLIITMQALLKRTVTISKFFHWNGLILRHNVLSMRQHHNFLISPQKKYIHDSLMFAHWPRLNIRKSGADWLIR
jgi:hypothetical protein